MPSRAALLVVAGESSGDLMAGRVLEHLDAPTHGIGGPALASRGARLYSDLPALASMGVTDVVARLPRFVCLMRRLLGLARELRPRAALLVGYSELNGWLGPRLRELGIQVLWYAAPQVWAWRRGRVGSLGRACDKMVVLFPFEEAIWRSAGVDACYFGHPALERSIADRAAARARLGLAAGGRYALLLPGSRRREIDHLAGVLLASARRLWERLGVRSVLACAPGLSPAQEKSLEQAARRSDVVARRVAPELFAAFDVALACSGTATLECAIAGVPPVVVYRTDAFTAALAGRLLKVSDIGLPNLVLGRRVFPELVQRSLCAESAAAAASGVLERSSELGAACRMVREALVTNAAAKPSERVADILRAWLR